MHSCCQKLCIPNCHFLCIVGYRLQAAWKDINTNGAIDGGDISLSSLTNAASLTVSGATPAQPGGILGNTTVCNGTAQVYSISSVSGATSYTWTLPGGWTGSSTSTSISTTAGNTSGNISVTANNICGGSIPKTLSVTVNFLPNTPVITPTGPLSVCPNVTTNLTVQSPQAGVTYFWSDGGTGTTHPETNFNGSVYCWGNNSCGISFNSNTVFINLTPVPSQPGPISGLTSVCQNSTQIYSINPVVNATSYIWTLPGGWTGSSNTTSINAVVGSNSGNISVIANNNCGSSIPRTLSVASNPLPDASITPNGPTTFCSGGNVTLNGIVTANRSYQWKKNGSIISGATASSYIATTFGTYKVNVTNTLTGCSKTTSTGTIVTVKSNPSATITPGGPTTFCAGGNVVLQANTGTGFTYQWKRNGVYLSNVTSSYTATTAGTYKVVVTNANGCTKISSGVVVIINCKEGDQHEITENMEMFPNPTNGIVTLKFNSLINQDCDLKVIDITGREIMQENFRVKEGLNIHEIDLRKLAKGVYLIQMKNLNEEIVQKIVVE